MLFIFVVYLHAFAKRLTTEPIILIDMAIEYRNVRTVRNIRLCLSINISAVHSKSLVSCDM